MDYNSQTYVHKKHPGRPPKEMSGERSNVQKDNRLYIKMNVFEK
jgi:hypothetical protein